jgi:hypothetical protein
MIFKRKLSKWMFIIIVILLGLTGVTLLISLNTLEKKHEEEIRKVISTNGGQVIKIEKVEPKTSPFAEDFNKSNVIYKITYNKLGTELVAWYRGVTVVNNIHAKNPTALEGGYGEKWITPSNP